MKAFNYFMNGQRSKASNPADMMSPNDRSSELSGRPFMAPMALPVAGNGDSVANYEDNGEFRCKSCLRGPPLTKKYAKNQCQTCYKKEKKI